MLNLYNLLFDWMEVWAPLIPLLVFLVRARQPGYMQPVLLYLLIAFLLYILVDVIWKRKSLGIDIGIENNNPLYNVNSIARFLLLSIFFVRLQQPFMVTVKKILPFAFIAFVLINFIFFEDFVRSQISSVLHSVESGLLLLYCLLYYFYLLSGEQSSFKKLPSFWVVTGLSILVVVSFSIYLFYDAMIKGDIVFTVNIWKIHKVAFLVFCLLTAKGLYAVKS